MPWRIRTEIVARAAITRNVTKRAWKDRPDRAARRAARQAARRRAAAIRATKVDPADPAAAWVDRAAAAAVRQVAPAVPDRVAEAAAPSPKAWATKKNSRIAAESAARISRAASQGSRDPQANRVLRERDRLDNQDHQARATLAAEAAAETQAHRQAARADLANARAFCQEHLSGGRPSGRPFSCPVP